MFRIAAPCSCMCRAHARNSIDTAIIDFKFTRMHDSYRIVVIIKSTNCLSQLIGSVLFVRIGATNQRRQQWITSTYVFNTVWPVRVSCISNCNIQLTHTIKFQVDSIMRCSCVEDWFTIVGATNDVNHIVYPEVLR
jgi:hypothetical protein